MSDPTQEEHMENVDHPASAPNGRSLDGRDVDDRRQGEQRSAAPTDFGGPENRRRTERRRIDRMGTDI